MSNPTWDGDWESRAVALESEIATLRAENERLRGQNTRMARGLALAAAETAEARAEASLAQSVGAAHAAEAERLQGIYCDCDAAEKELTTLRAALAAELAKRTLRPMSEAPEGEHVIFKTWGDAFVIGRRWGSAFVTGWEAKTGSFPGSAFRGWLPLPEPIEPDAAGAQP